eukprot:9051963-Pyramimonas_sp.AAC.1
MRPPRERMPEPNVKQTPRTARRCPGGVARTRPPPIVYQKISERARRDAYTSFISNRAHF